MNYQGIRDQLAVALDSLDVNVYATPPETVVTPAVIVGSVKRSGRAELMGTQRVTVEVLVLVSRKHSDQWQLLDELCEPAGVQAALEGAMFDGLDVQVTDVDQIGSVEVDGVSHYAAVVTVEVFC